MIMVGPGGALIRNLRPDALLNENFFRESLLQAGDVLTFGQCQYKLIESGAETAASAGEDTAKPTSESAAALQEAAEQIGRLRAELQAAREESQAAKAQAEQAAANVPSAGNANLEAEIAAARALLQKERAEAEALLKAERDRLVQEAAALQAEKEAFAQAPPADSAESQSLQKREAQLADRELQLQEAIVREQTDLDAQREKLELDRERLEQERELALAELEQERQSLAAEPVVDSPPFEPPAQVEQPFVAAEPPVESFEEQLHETPAETSDADSAKAAEEAMERIRAAGILLDSPEEDSPAVVSEPAAPVPVEEPEEEPKPSLGDKAPVSFIDQYAGSFDDEEYEEPAAPVEPVLPPMPESQPEPINDSGEEDHEGSIENYMAQLMQRMQGGPPGVAKVQTPVSTSAKPASKPQQPAVKKEPKVEEPVDVLDPSEYKPRSCAPEQTSNLAAMRDLANQSARSAISTSTQRMRWTYAGARFGMALFFFGIGAVMLFMTQSIFSPLLLGSLVTVIGGGVLCYQGAQIIAGKDPRATKSPKSKKKEEKDNFEDDG